MKDSIIAWRELEIKNGDFIFDGGTSAFAPNQVIALIGSNGAGKSTLLRCLVGLFPPVRGDVLYNGKSLAKFSLKEKAQFASWCPSKLSIPFSYSCLELVLLGRFAHHQGLPTSKDRDLAEAALKRVDLDTFRHRKVNQLSSGELQRVMIARCLAAQSQLMFLDEPSANLDTAHAISVFEILRDLRQEGITSIVSVHDLNLAHHYSDNVLLLSSGKILSSGPTQDTLTSENLQMALHIRTTKIEISNDKSFLATLGRA